MKEILENPSLTNKPNQLRTAWEGIQKARPSIRIREAARTLNVSEAQLLATTVGENCVRLQEKWPELVKFWKKLGPVMSLTRNDACILENKGPFQKVNTFGDGNNGMGTVIGPIESRIFFENWHTAFAVRQEKNDRLLQSIQVFDKAGDAVTKVYLQKKSSQEAWDQLIPAFRSLNQSQEQTVEPYLPEAFSEEIDKANLLADWHALKDTHAFFPMLRKYQLHRQHALELASGVFTYQLQPDAVQQLLEKASADQLPIMIFAGNRGNLQIHQGKVRTIRLLERGHTGQEKWLNVLDPAFNMHLRMDLVNTVWVVKKPTRNGIVTSIELFDKEKSLIAQFFGLRKPRIPQQEEWHLLVADLPRLTPEVE